MGLLERLFLLGIGCAIGYVLARIVDRLRAIEQKVDTMDEHVANPSKHDDGFMEIRYLKDILYVLVLVVTLLGVWRSETALNAAEARAEADEKTRCEAGVDNRNVDRGIVDAMYSLALGVTIRQEDDPPRTPAEEIRLQAYLDSLDYFRESTYDKIKPSSICRGYVEDDNVEPTPITIEDLMDQRGATNER